MKGDFSRSSFNATKHYCGVRLQQGRVQMDADWNEQVDILLHQSARDLNELRGDTGAPKANAGFRVALHNTTTAAATGGALPPPDLRISKGQRYVAGLLCSNEADTTFTQQIDFPGAAQQREQLAGAEQYLVYLDVWQHHITGREDDDLPEVALDGLDTTTRIKTVAQVKFWPVPADLPQSDPHSAAPSPLLAAFQAFQQGKQQSKGQLKAEKLTQGAIQQNQLYRVEVHSVENDQINFKWSRENGAVAYSILAIIAKPNSEQVDIKLKQVKAAQLDLRNNDWVEICSNDGALNGQTGPLGRVVDVQPDLQLITIQPQAKLPESYFANSEKLTFVLQRWDQGESQTGVVGTKRGAPVVLENSIQITFNGTGDYSVGDYWLIPARANLNNGIGGIIWPKENLSKPPDGVRHHYAPLGLLRYNAGVWQLSEDETQTFQPLPILTTKVDKLETQVTKAENDIIDLQERVDKLEKEVAEIRKLVKLEQTSLYQNFQSDVELTKGDVVAMDSESDFRVVPANSTNQTLVIGVVDDVITGDFPYRVILQGRAQCKVIGSVKAGAMLTPTELDGCVEQGGLYLQPGTIVGKALRSHLTENPEEVALVDILVTLN